MLLTVLSTETKPCTKRANPARAELPSWLHNSMCNVQCFGCLLILLYGAAVLVFFFIGYGDTFLIFTRGMSNDMAKLDSYMLLAN